MVIRSDAPARWSIGFQDPATPVMEGIINLHHDIMYFMIMIMGMVIYIMIRIIYKYDYRKNREEMKEKRGALIEAIWTLMPTVILIFIAVPSYALLYAMEEEVDAGVTVKIIGHQWYWSYEYSDYGEEGISYDSYMIGEEDLEEGDLRMLEVDNRMVLPIRTHVRLLMTSSDVIHSWAVPSLGVKCDAVPGRLSQVWLYMKREGVYYGQCSELCGINHAYMPIVVEGVKVEGYKEWIKNKIREE
uniref:Cytochrome c oxidase subunit 2 n=1 Tax=Galdieria phlegrea TaxID=1389228 RepID=A0A7H0WB54_9RHOD|nr:cytochrome c oxidase subunit II [Galdieria phlegrea]QNR39783.1 cytochrome c oxidase subunit II [Galdieria phlegrea]